MWRVWLGVHLVKHPDSAAVRVFLAEIPLRCLKPPLLQPRMVHRLRLQDLLERLQRFHLVGGRLAKNEPLLLRITSRIKIGVPYERRDQQLTESPALLLTEHEIHDQLLHVTLEICDVAIVSKRQNCQICLHRRKVPRFRRRRFS